VFVLVEAEILEAYLRRGLSLEAIGTLTGRDPSTVGYWVKKHGLAAVHRDRHAPKGGIDRETLAAVVDEGLSTREIAEGLGLSQSTVRHWLRKHGLRTELAQRRNSLPGGAPSAKMTCKRHGLTEFRLEGRGAYRCARCRSDAVSKRRRRLKEILVDEAGGRCMLCGYARYVGALEFHHRDPETKEFGIGNRGLTRSLDAVRAEAAKCVLLCANCHSEVEGGIVKIA
jgi:DNA-binding transcriptional ArsR family regulator